MIALAALAVLAIVVTLACLVMNADPMPPDPTTYHTPPELRRPRLCAWCGNPTDERYHNPITGRCLGDYEY